MNQQHHENQLNTFFYIVEFVIRLERSLTQTLRQQQDEAYEQSLRADQEKERLRQLEKEKIIQKQLDEEAELFAEQQRKEVWSSILMAENHDAIIR